LVQRLKYKCKKKKIEIDGKFHVGAFRLLKMHFGQN
jgi:hypothetical protein